MKNRESEGVMEYPFGFTKIDLPYCTISTVNLSFSDLGRSAT